MSAVDGGHARHVPVAQLPHRLESRRRDPATLVTPVRDAHEDGDCGPIGPRPYAVADLLPRRVTEVHGSRGFRGPRADDVADARLGALLASAPAGDVLSRVARRRVDDEHVVPRLVVIVRVGRLPELP